MNYKNGRRLTQETIEAIRFVSKVGLISKAAWYELFARGRIRWRQAQWKSLIDSKIFRPHPCSIISDVVVMGDFGKRLVQKRGWKCSVSFLPKDIAHDEIVGIGLWKMEQIGLCKKWMHQKEMKLHQVDAFKLRIKKNQCKYPDAVFKMINQGKEELVAVEYESENATMWCYEPLLRAYQGNDYFDRIHFIVTNKTTRLSLRNTLNKIADVDFASKIECIDVENWSKKGVRHCVHEAHTSVA